MKIKNKYELLAIVAQLYITMLRGKIHISSLKYYRLYILFVTKTMLQATKKCLHPELIANRTPFFCAKIYKIAVIILLNTLYLLIYFDTNGFHRRLYYTQILKQ